MFSSFTHGLSWAFHLAHVAHENLAEESLPGVEKIADRSPPPPLIPGVPRVLIYADNSNHVGL